MPSRNDPAFAEKRRIRSRFFILLIAAIILVGLLIWVTFEVFDLDAIDAFNAIV
ncbi:hypothetical protein [uncultured Bartonella sp.]|uniref:hypothetical protein n=1 Tax=uncultured Bartonella sp. TaxID=104108 RepID=UPI00261ED06C|nr:hypothetical protein [uncultured Bartonella sp.]